MPLCCPDEARNTNRVMLSIAQPLLALTDGTLWRIALMGSGVLEFCALSGIVLLLGLTFLHGPALNKRPAFLATFPFIACAYLSLALAALRWVCSASFFQWPWGCRRAHCPCMRVWKPFRPDQPSIAQMLGAVAQSCQQVRRKGNSLARFVTEARAAISVKVVARFVHTDKREPTNYSPRDKIRCTSGGKR